MTRPALLCFSTLSHQWHDFGKTELPENKTCFDFLYNFEPYTDTFETFPLKYVVTGPETSLVILLETSSEPRPAQGCRPTAATVAMRRVGGGSWCGELF